MAQTLRIAIGGDHGGFELKDQIGSFLKSKGHHPVDCGTNSKDAVDYPKIAYAVAQQVANGDCQFGIMVDGAGIGSAMTASKVRGVRAAACYNEALANNAREHNDANYLTLGAGQTSVGLAKKIVDIFISTPCSEERHQKRVQLIKDVERGPIETYAPPSLPKPKVSKEANLQDLAPDDIQRITQRVRQLMACEGLSGSIGLAIKIEPSQLAKMMDHTILKPESSQADIEKICAEAIKFQFCSVCVNSSYTRAVANLLRGSGVKTCTVVGFPLGAMPPDIKAAETRKAIREGADEIDMVINVGALKSGQNDLVLEDIRAVVEACKDGRALSKVIFETALLTDEEKVVACNLCVQAGADYVKTSTGFSSGGATVQDVALMSSIVSSRGLKVKASGGVRCYDDAIKMIEAGASRLGVSASVQIIEEAQAIAEGKHYVKKTSKGNY